MGRWMALLRMHVPLLLSVRITRAERQTTRLSLLVTANALRTEKNSRPS